MHYSPSGDCTNVLHLRRHLVTRLVVNAAQLCLYSSEITLQNTYFGIVTSENIQ